MHPLIPQELGDAFSVEHALQYGLLPTTFSHDDPVKYLESYVQTYLREEVLQEGLTRNLGSFTRFLEAASFSQGQVLNVTEIARELGLNRLMVAQYFDILDDLLLAVRISPFAIRAKRKVIAHQKFYFFDAGVYRIVRPRGLLDSIEEAEGAGLETLVLQVLRAVNDYYDLGYTIYFWRTSTGQEVDFVLYGPQGLHAFEIKRSATITNKALKGLQVFAEEYPEATLHVLFMGKQPEYHGAITIRPLLDTLVQLPTLLRKPVV
jgi:predicted AAA+ superfamily ATPase